MMGGGGGYGGPVGFGTGYGTNMQGGIQAPLGSYSNTN